MHPTVSRCMRKGAIIRNLVTRCAERSSSGAVGFRASLPDQSVHPHGYRKEIPARPPACQARQGTGGRRVSEERAPRRRSRGRHHPLVRAADRRVDIRHLRHVRRRRRAPGPPRWRDRRRTHGTGRRPAGRAAAGRTRRTARREVAPVA